MTDFSRPMTEGRYVTELAIFQSAQRHAIAENEGKLVNYYADKIRELMREYHCQQKGKL